MADNEVKIDEELKTTTEEVVETAEVKPTKKRRKIKRNVPVGQVHIMASFNNTIVSYTDPSGNVLVSSSAGANGFRGSKKGTAYAGQIASETAGQIAKTQYGMTRAEVFVKGIGLGRDSAVRAIGNLDIQVDNLNDVTGVAHGGVRPKKARRV